MAGNAPRLVVATSTFPRTPDDAEPGFVWRLCEQLAARFMVTVVCPHADGLPANERWGAVRIVRFRYAPAPLEQLAYGGGLLARVRSRPARLLLLPFYFFGFARALRRGLAGPGTPALHADWVIPGALAACLTGRLGAARASVCTLHGGDVFALRRYRLDWAMRRIANRFDTVACVSPAVAVQAREIGVHTGRVVEISMGVAPWFEAPADAVDRDPRQIIFVGRLVEKKGVATLIDAFARCQQVEPSLRLCIVGDGPLRGALRAQARRRLADLSCVEFAGACPPREVAARLQRAAIFVFPSQDDRFGDAEGLGLTALEAALAGCAVVSSDLPANRHVFADGSTALIAPPGNVAVLADAMLRLARDRPLRLRLAAAAQDLVAREYGAASLAQRYADALSNPRMQA